MPAGAGAWAVNPKWRLRVVLGRNPPNSRLFRPRRRRFATPVRARYVALSAWRVSVAVRNLQVLPGRKLWRVARLHNSAGVKRTKGRSGGQGRPGAPVEAAGPTSQPGVRRRYTGHPGHKRGVSSGPDRVMSAKKRSTWFNQELLVG